MKYFIIMALIAIILTIGINPIYAQKSTIKYEQDFNDNTLQVFNQLFEDCPAGTVLYKLNGELVVVCLIDSIYGIVVNHGDSSETTNIDVHVDYKNKQGPDKSCLFDVSQPKCAPDKDGNCPDGFNMNEDGRCFPDHSDEGCPNGYHGVDDDETGQCYKDDEEDCPDGMELKDGNCTYKEEENPPVEEEPPVVSTEQPEEVTEEQQPQEDNNSLSEDSETTTEEENNEDNSEPETTEEESNN